MDSYNISEAISQGEARTGATEQLNNQIRINNKAARDAVPGKVSGDELKGGIGGIKDVITEGAALNNFNQTLDSYNSAVKSGKAAGAGAEAGLNVDRPAAAITTSEGVLPEGSDILKVGSTGADVLSGGARVASVVGKGVGIAGGLASSALDISADIKAGGIAGDNLEEKIANIGTIGGTALDMIGLIPGLQLAGVIGAGMQVASGLLDATGQAIQTAKSVSTDSKPPPATQQTAQASLAGSFASVRS